MKKFSKFFLIILVIFIVGGLSARFFISTSEEDEKLAEDEAANSIPGYDTLLHIQQIAEQQQLENALLDVQIDTNGERNSALIKMQSNEFMEHDTLLKDSFDMLTKLNQVEQLDEVTYIWYKPVNNQNTTALTFTLSNEGLNQLMGHTYREIETFATHYESFIQ